MVNTTVDTISPTRVKLTIVVSPDELKPSVDAAYKEIASQVSIPGFRKGKVPNAIIDQRVGRTSVLQQAVSNGLDDFYREALQSEDLVPLSRPNADVTVWPEEKDFSGDLTVEVEVDVRPKVELPAYEGLKVEVEPVAVSADDIQQQIDELRSRFGTLITVDRPIATGDTVVLNLEATIDGAVVDTASEISYEVGSGELIEGIDEALDTLTAGESTTFASTLLGGDHEGKEAQIAVSVISVKERELPELDDDFAQIASPFDTMEELRKDAAERISKNKAFSQVTEARQKLIDQLLEAVEIPVPTELIDQEVLDHLTNEGLQADDPHGDEVRENSIKTFKTQLILDEIVKAQDLRVSQEELSQYVVQSAAQYGMDPNEFIKAIDGQGQVPQLIADIARTKAATYVVSKAEVTDTKGKQLDLSEFVDTVLGSALADAHDHDHDHDHDHSH